jgi:hypothetical protein
VKCDRCGGLMFDDDITDAVEASPGRIVVSRCAICGNVVDDVILRNRTFVHASRLREGVARFRFAKESLL